MARNMISGKETQKMQEYTQERINQAERRGVEFPTDVKEQISEYANLQILVSMSNQFDISLDTLLKDSEKK